MKTSTIPVSAPRFLVIDANGLSIGRVATAAAHILRGKHKAAFSRHQLCGDHVIVLNVEKLEIHTGKLRRNVYKHHTGRIGGMKEKPLHKVMKEKPEMAIEHAVKGMLTNNRLRPLMLKRLHVFQGTEHPYAPQKPVFFDLSILS